MKRSKLIVLVLALVMSFAMFAVACDDSPATPPDPGPGQDVVYTVTFKDGDTTVKSVNVNAGSALAAADIPAAPAAAEDKAFDGWFAGDAEVAAGYTPTADVTASAKYTQLKKVEFKIDGNTVKTVYVRPGAKLADEQLPEEVDKPAYSFAGWYVGDELFDTDEDTVESDVVLEADYVRIAYIVKFVNGDDEVSVKYIDLGQDAKLSAADIPSAPAAGQGEIFLGWYSGSVKAEVNAAISADTVFEAAFVSEASYDGVWYNDELCLMAVLDYEDGINAVNVMGKTNKEFTYDAANGSCSYSEGALSSKKTYKLTAVGDVLLIDFTEYDDVEENFVTTTYALTKGAPVDYAGKYVKDGVNSDYITVTDGGVIPYFKSSNIFYARLYADGDAYKLAYKNYDYSDLTVADAEIDDKGNIVVTGGTGVNNSYKGMFVKDVTAVSSYNYDSSYYLYDYTLTGGEHLYVYNDNFQSFSYATVEGTVELDAVLTVSVGEKEYIVKIVSSYQMEFASDERGVYTGTVEETETTLFLDGFGTATAGGNEESSIDYYMIGNTAVFADGDGGAAIVDKAAKTFELAVEDGKQAEFSEFDGSVKLKLDGYGGVVETNYSYRYIGTYEFDADGSAVTITGTDRSDGVYNVLEGGKVLESEDGDTVFIDDSYIVQSGIQAFVGDNDGWWQKEDDASVYVAIDTEKGKITYNGEVKDYETNWNGTKLEFNIYMGSPSYKTVYYTVTVVGGKLNISYVDSDETPVTETYVSAPQPVIEKNAFDGVWTGNDMNFWFDGYSAVVVDSTKTTYTVEADVASFSANGVDFTAVFKGDNLTITWDDGEYNGNYEAAPAVLDAFAGKWNPPAEEYYQYILTFSGAGVVRVYRETAYSTTDVYVKYTVSDGKATFSADYNDWTCTMGVDNTMEVVALDSDGYGVFNDGTFTKETEVTESDAIAGTYTYDDWSLAFDGFGQVTVTRGGDEETVSYSLSGKTAEFTALTCDFECTIKDNGNLNVIADYGDTFNNVEFVKQASEELDAFAGTWNGTNVSSNVLIFDGKGGGSFNGIAFTYVVEGSVAKISAFGSFDGETNTATMTDGSISVSFDDSYGENAYSDTFTKQAA